MKLILEQFGGAFLYAVLGSGICAALFWVIEQLSV